MKKPNYATKEQAKKAFMINYGLSDEDMKTLWEWLIEYGTKNGMAKHRSIGNQLYLEAICEKYALQYKSWAGNMTKELKAKLKESYPQLMVQNKNFEFQ